MDRRSFLEYGLAAGAAAIARPLSSADASDPRRPPPRAEPPAGHPTAFALEEATIAELQEGMRAGRLTARAIAEQYLSRIEEVDRRGPAINAVIEVNPDALAIADALDRERQGGRVRGPLHGIPIILKDNFDTHDLPTSGGSPGLRTPRVSRRDMGHDAWGATHLMPPTHRSTMAHHPRMSTVHARYLMPQPSFFPTERRDRGAGGRLARLALARLALAGLAALGIHLMAAPAAAQEGAVAGVVVTTGTSVPIPDVQIQVVGTGRGALTDAGGRFRITGLTAAEGTEVELEARRLGYRPARQRARVGDTNVRIALAERSVELEEVVVTGTPGGTERRALGNAVSTIDATRATEQAQINNVQQLINGRAAGVVIQPASGAVGTGARVRVRGVASFSLSNEPLIYIDGVRANNTPATGPENQAFGSTSISRMNDINPEDIESIEIIKGPAAATLYGTEASNGVIQIITKRGTAGAPRWNLVVKQGINYLRDPEGRFWTNYQRNPDGEIVSIDIIEREEAAGRPIFESGRLQEYDLSVGGGSDRFRYFAGGGFEDNEGVEPTNKLRKANARLNLTLMPRDNMSLGFNVGYVTGPTDLSAEAGFGGRVWSTVLADARKIPGGGGDTTRRGFHSGLPEEYDRLYHFTQDLNRFTGGIRFEHQITPWLTHRLNAGLDRTREANEIFFPRIDALQTFFGSEALGRKTVEDRQTDYKTVDYAATATFDLMPTLRSSTSVGGQYYHAAIDTVFAHGTIFAAPGQSSVSATTSSRIAREDFVEDITVGFYVQEQLGWRDRLFVTGALRTDDNSAFGQNFDRVYYPKASLSWVVSEEPFWRLPFAQTFRLRAAYGESGKQPLTFAALRTYTSVTGPGDQPAISAQFIGNPDLGPERGKEIELGFDAGFLNDRLGLELTYYNKRTTDAILERETAPSTGIPGTQFFNAGEIRNTGLEMLARARPVARPAVGWEVTFNLATNDNEILSLGPAFDALPREQQFVNLPAGFLRHQVGFPVGAFFEKKVVHAERNAQGEITNVRCDDGRGGSVLCAGADGRFGTADDAPAIYLGRAVPDLEGSIGNTVTLWNQLRLYALFDFKRGHRKVDGNLRVRCNFFGGRCRENFFPQEFDPKRIAQVQSNNNLVDFLIDDASFTKLREVSVSYTLPDRWAAAMRANRAVVSLAGRNLYTWTSYGGLEPEAMFLGGSRGGNHGAWEQTTLPQLSQWVLMFNLGF